MGPAGSVQSNTETPPWYQACAITSRPGMGMSEPLWATQFSSAVCATGQLVVAPELELSIRQGEDGVGAPFLLVARPALGLAAAAPLVAEQDLGAVVVEGGGVPVGEIRVGGLVDPLRAGGVADVEQKPVAAAGAAGEADRGVQRDVVALGRPGIRIGRDRARRDV